MGMNPLAIGYFTAAYLGDTGRGLAFAVTLLGIFSVMDFTQILKYSLTMIAAVIIMNHLF
jgi:stage II sporulation protein E